MGRSRKRKKRKTIKQAGESNKRPRHFGSGPSFKGTFWLWFGAAMAAFGILAALQTVLELAKWADYLVRSWSEITTQFWSQFARLFGAKLYPEIVPHLNFTTGIAAIGFSAMALETRSSPLPPYHFRLERIFERFTRSMSIAVLALALYFTVQDAVLFGNSPLKLWDELSWPPRLMIICGIVGGITILVLHGFRAALHALLLAGFVAAFYLMLALPFAFSELAKGQAAAEAHRNFVLAFTFGLLPSQVVFGLNFASPRYLNYRFVLIALTIATILALSYLSRVLSLWVPS